LISEVKNGATGFIKWWCPVEELATSTQKSINPKNLVIRTEEKHFEDFPIVDKSTKNTIHYILNNQNAIRYENYAPRGKDFLPVSMIVLNKFSIKGAIGKAKNRKEFGKWQYDNLILE
jgi:hypothetical protein